MIAPLSRVQCAYRPARRPRPLTAVRRLPFPSAGGELSPGQKRFAQKLHTTRTSLAPRTRALTRTRRRAGDGDKQLCVGAHTTPRPFPDPSHVPCRVPEALQHTPTCTHSAIEQRQCNTPPSHTHTLRHSHTNARLIQSLERLGRIFRGMVSLNSPHEKETSILV